MHLKFICRFEKVHEYEKNHTFEINSCKMNKINTKNKEENQKTEIKKNGRKLLEVSQNWLETSRSFTKLACGSFPQNQTTTPYMGQPITYRTLQ